jgi:hypothetical protein
MTQDFSTPLTELPGFLSTISMVVDDRSLIVQSLVQAERKSPSVYEPAKDLFCRVLQGDFNVNQAISQARKILDPTERRCAVNVLQASASFLNREKPAHVGPLPPMSYTLPNGMNLSVAPLLLRHCKQERVMVLHFWQKPLSQWQVNAAGAVIQSALATHQRDYLGREIDFISVSLPERASSRRFERYDWTKVKPLTEAELARFWKQLLAAWSEYQRREPRAIRRRRDPDMFGPPS